MKLKRMVVDIESYYDDDYSMKKLITPLYVRDERFYIHGIGVEEENNGKYWVSHDDIGRFAADCRSAQNVLRLVGHNLRFDGLILHELLGITPARWTDTLGLARALLPPLKGYGLEDLGPLLRLGEKGKDLKDIKGLYDLPPELEARLAEYCLQDVTITAGIDNLLYTHLPDKERYLLHMTTRMAAEPVLIASKTACHAEYQREKALQESTIKASGYSATELRSRVTFPNIVRELTGEEPPKKLNPKGKETWAFGKDDPGFRSLQANYPQFAHVWKGKLAAASTNNLNRAKRFYEISHTGLLPMPLTYYGAHTGRWSGADKINVQNLQRGGALRRAILAPPGCDISVYDSSQIELRVNMWFCEQEDKLEVLRAGGDVYCHTASAHYGVPVTKADKDKRQFGKLLELALGYGMGWFKFRVNAALGFMGTPEVHMNELEAQATVFGWRDRNHKVRDMWDWLGKEIIPAMADENCHVEYKCVVFKHERVELPNGLALQYPDLHWSEDYEGWVYWDGKKHKRFYGGIFLENIIQALARIVVADQMVEIDHIPEVRVVSSTHDEAISINPRNRSTQVLAQMHNIMSTPPAWAPDLPLDAEGGSEYNYSK